MCCFIVTIFSPIHVLPRWLRFYLHKYVQNIYYYMDGKVTIINPPIVLSGLGYFLTVTICRRNGETIFQPKNIWIAKDKIKNVRMCCYYKIQK